MPSAAGAWATAAPGPAPACRGTCRSCATTVEWRRAVPAARPARRSRAHEVACHRFCARAAGCAAGTAPVGTRAQPPRAHWTGHSMQACATRRRRPARAGGWRPSQFPDRSSTHRCASARRARAAGRLRHQLPRLAHSHMTILMKTNEARETRNRGRAVARGASTTYRLAVRCTPPQRPYPSRLLHAPGRDAALACAGAQNRHRQTRSCLPAT